MKLLTYRSHAIVGAVCLLVGGITGYNLTSQPRIIVEQAEEAIRLPSGGLVAERVPDAEVPKPIKTAAKEAKAKVIRAGSVTVQPKQEECPPVKIDWGLVKRDEGHRMVFTTDDGTILSATDIPVKTVEITRHPKWSVGAIAPINDPGGVGPTVERHFGKLSVGAAAVRIDQKWTGLATIKVSW